MNVSGVICMTRRPNQVLFGPTDQRSLATMATTARNKTFVIMADVWAKCTVAGHPTHTPVVYSVLSV